MLTARLAVQGVSRAFAAWKEHAALKTAKRRALAAAQAFHLRTLLTAWRQLGHRAAQLTGLMRQAAARFCMAGVSRVRCQTGPV